MIEENSNMFVVVAVVSIIVLGIAAFLFYLEMRLGRAEKRMRDLEEMQDPGSRPDKPGASG